VGTPDDGGRLPPRDLTGEQIFTERDFRDREGSAGRRATDDGEGRRTTEAPDDGRRKRRKTDDGAGDVTDRRQISELGGLGSVGITGRRTADDGCAGRRTTDDGFSRSVRREISERERGLRAK
jgi:hypothetical protein